MNKKIPVIFPEGNHKITLKKHAQDLKNYTYMI